MKRAARGGPRDATSRCRSCWETSRYSSTRCRRRDRPRRWVTMRYRNSLARQFVTRRARVSGPILTVSPVARSRIEGLPMRNRSRPSSAKEKERKKQGSWGSESRHAASPNFVCGIRTHGLGKLRKFHSSKCLHHHRRREILRGLVLGHSGRPPRAVAQPQVPKGGARRQ